MKTYKIKYIYCFLILSTLFAVTSSFTSNNCIKKDVFSYDFISLIEKGEELVGLKEIVIKDLKSKITVLDAYGYSLDIKKANECEYHFYLKPNFDFKVLYKLNLMDDGYQISVDTSRKNIEKIELQYSKQVIMKKYEELEDAYHNGKNINADEIDSLYSDFFFGCIKNSENEYLECFKEMKKNFPVAYLGHKYSQMERILVDFGYLKHKYSTADKGRIYERKFSY